MAMATENELPKSMQSSLKSGVYSFSEQLLAEKVSLHSTGAFPQSHNICLCFYSNSTQGSCYSEKKMDQALQVDDEDPASIRTMTEILIKELKDRASPNDQLLLLLS